MLSEPTMQWVCMQGIVDSDVFCTTGNLKMHKEAGEPTIL